MNNSKTDRLKSPRLVNLHRMFWLGVIAFIGGIVATVRTGHIGGIPVAFFASLWIMFAILAIAQEHGNRVKKKENAKSLMLGISGLLLQIGAGDSALREMSRNHSLMFVVGTWLLIWGLCYYAEAKGRSGYWGFFGLLSIFGVIILALLRNDNQQTQLPEQEGNEGQLIASESTPEPETPDPAPPEDE